jgi:DNA-binding NarL/FixJ family response regulator
VPAKRLASTPFRLIVERLALAVFVFRDSRVLYSNRSAQNLLQRLRSRYNIELMVMLQDHLSRLQEEPSSLLPAATLITTQSGEPFYVHVIVLSRHEVAVTVRELGSEIEAFRKRYRLSRREMQVAELVLHGYRNREIATAFGISEATAKRHLTNIFDKVGVDSRTQLANRLA